MHKLLVAALGILSRCQSLRDLDRFAIRDRNVVTAALGLDNRLETEVGGSSLYFCFYNWALELFGEQMCDRMIGLFKLIHRPLGHTLYYQKLHSVVKLCVELHALSILIRHPVKTHWKE